MSGPHSSVSVDLAVEAIVEVYADGKPLAVFLAAGHVPVAVLSGASLKRLCDGVRSFAGVHGALGLGVVIVDRFTCAVLDSFTVQTPIADRGKK